MRALLIATFVLFTGSAHADYTNYRGEAALNAPVATICYEGECSDTRMTDNYSDPEMKLVTYGNGWSFVLDADGLRGSQFMGPKDVDMSKLTCTERTEGACSFLKH